MHLCECKAFVGESLSKRSTPKAWLSFPWLLSSVSWCSLFPEHVGVCPAPFPWASPGMLQLSSGSSGAVPGARRLHHSLAVTSKMTAPQFPHQKHARSSTALKRDGMRWFLWRRYSSHVSWREGGWFPWELPFEAWKAHQLQLWVGAPLCPRHHVANP